MKKRIVSFLVCAFFAVFAAGSVYAHTGDIFGGTYLYNSQNQKDLKLKIKQSAQTSLLNSAVYNSALDWNNITNNVHVSIIMEVPGMPTIAGTFSVEGAYSKEIDGVLGLTLPYDKNGNPGTDSKTVNGDWSYVTIYMNISDDAFTDASDPTAAAKKTFTHEVGHSLKLAHPQKNTSLSGHTYSDGRPYAIMNQGFPSGATASTVKSHDKDCLLAKWGA